MRFNKKGRFNVPFCRKPDRYRGAYVTKIANQVDAIGAIIRSADYTFLNQDWKQTLAGASSSDFTYVDPPYAGRHTDYFNSWEDSDAEALADALKRLPGGFALSTWLSNKYRVNDSVQLWFNNFDIRTETHFYHVGSHESLRNEMVEALVIKPGYGKDYIKQVKVAVEEGTQPSLF